MHNSISLPAHSGIVVSPVTIPPASKSMMSSIRAASAEFVAIFTTGAIGFPVGVPSPVVKSTRLAPAPVCAVTASTSLPGVHSRFSPGVVAYSGKSSTSFTGATPPLRAAPADLIASVISPSSIFPGDGFISKPECTARARAAYACISS